jgi:hypothetical protein
MTPLTLMRKIKHCKLKRKKFVLPASWRSLTIRAGSGSVSLSCWSKSVPKWHGSTTLHLATQFHVCSVILYIFFLKIRRHERKSFGGAERAGPGLAWRRHPGEKAGGILPSRLTGHHPQNSHARQAEIFKLPGLCLLTLYAYMYFEQICFDSSSAFLSVFCRPL